MVDYSNAPSFTLSSSGGRHTVYLMVENGAGTDSPVDSASITVTPLTTASPSGGVYDSNQYVTLSTSVPGHNPLHHQRRDSDHLFARLLVPDPA